MLIKAVKECKNEKTDNPEVPGYRSLRVNFFIDLYKSLRELQGLFYTFYNWNSKSKLCKYSWSTEAFLISSIRPSSASNPINFIAFLLAKLPFSILEDEEHHLIIIDNHISTGVKLY